MAVIVNIYLGAITSKSLLPQPSVEAITKLFRRLRPVTARPDATLGVARSTLPAGAVRSGHG